MVKIRIWAPLGKVEDYGGVHLASRLDKVRSNEMLVKRTGIRDLIKYIRYNLSNLHYQHPILRIVAKKKINKSDRFKY